MKAIKVMPPDTITFRSRNLLSANNSALVIIDVQEKLVPHIHEHQTVVSNIKRLISGASILGVPMLATEQYPRGLGSTIEEIRQHLIEAGSDQFPEKTMFSCRECLPQFLELGQQGVENLLLTGIETHVCVAQTALDLQAAGFNVFICVDAVGSRFLIDHDTALRRLENNGVTPTTTEAVLFEWCEKAGTPQFKQISNLVKEG